MPLYEVEISTVYYDTVTVPAANEVEAKEKARKVSVSSGMTVSEAEIHGVRVIEEDGQELALEGES